MAIKPLKCSLQMIRNNPFVFITAFLLSATLLANGNKTKADFYSYAHEKPKNGAAFQQLVVSGTVTDDKGVILPGVSIQEKGTNNGAVTDFDGKYSINIEDENSVLIFSYIGFAPQEITVGSSTTIDVKMEPDTEQLEEVVLVGYGSQKKSDLTGSVGSISSEVIDQKPTVNPVDALAGKIPGVNIYNGSGRPGGGFRVRIRGLSSINASNNPLYVIDGVVGGDLELINPNDIESINVLKDASSTAIYGAQGANGVVIVTTKKAKSGKVNVTFDTSTGFGVIAKKIDLLNSQEFLQMRRDLYDDIRTYTPDAAPFLLDYDGSDYPQFFNSDGSAKYDTDWQDESTRTAISSRYYLNVSGSSEHFDGGMSVGFQDEEGILLNTFLEKTTARFFGNFKVSDKFKLGGSVNFGYTNQNRLDQYRTGALTPTRLMIEMPPIYPVRYPDGTYSKMEDLLRKNGAPDIYNGYNPVSQLKKDLELDYKDYQILGNVYMEVDLAKGLTFKSTYGRQIRINNLNQYVTRNFDTFLDQNSASINNVTEDNWQIENLLTYKTNFGKHDINAILGASWYGYEQFSSSATAEDFADEFYSYYNLGAGSNPPVVGSSYTSSSLNSYFARANYTYDQKYLLTGTLRYDGSSRFGANNRYAVFPSAALGWRVSQEDFLKDSKAITNLKLRASYGQTGNNTIGDYAALGSPGIQDVIFDKERTVGSSQGVQPNSNLKWEKTTETNFGLDVEVFNRVSLTADVYKRKTTDLLFNKPVPSFTGYNSVLSNIGAVENKGLELGLNSTNIVTNDFNWNTQINFSTNKNKVLELGTNNEDVFTGFFFSDQIFRVGEPIASWWGMKRLTAWGTDQADEAAVYGRVPGDVRWEDVNDDGKYDREDQRILGSPFPDYEIGFINNFSYKNWDLSVDIHISQGADILNSSVIVINDRYQYANAYSEFYNKRWTPTNQNTIWPRVRTDLKAFSSFDSGHIFDGSFIRGRNLTLSYTVPQKLVDRYKLSNLKFYGNIQNFFLITDYFGWDPEVSSNDNSPWSIGFDFYGYPKPRTINFGVKVGF